MTTPTPLMITSEDTPAEVRAVYDALLALMGNEWVNVNAYSSEDTTGAKTCGVTVHDAAGNQFQYMERTVPAAPPVLLDTPEGSAF